MERIICVSMISYGDIRFDIQMLWVKTCFWNEQWSQSRFYIVDWLSNPLPLPFHVPSNPDRLQFAEGTWMPLASWPLSSSDYSSFLPYCYLESAPAPVIFPSRYNLSATCFSCFYPWPRTYRSPESLRSLKRTCEMVTTLLLRITLMIIKALVTSEIWVNQRRETSSLAVPIKFFRATPRIHK